MSITKNRMNWECLANHLPDWIEDNDYELHSYFTESEKDRIRFIAERYEYLTKLEQSTNAFDIFGIEDEKNDLVLECIKLYEKYKHKI